MTTQKAPSVDAKPTKSPPSKAFRFSTAALIGPLFAYGIFKGHLLDVVGRLRPSPEMRSTNSSAVQTSIADIDFAAMHAQYAAACPDHRWETHIFSTDPLIVYIENYLAFEETQYLLNLAVPYYMRSPVSKGYNLDAYDPEIRSSMSAVVPNDPIVSCIEKRSVDFQGYMPVSHLEDIQVVKYEVGDQFRPHFDWFSGMENPRLSTIFVYLACDDCRGGNTQFPDFSGRFTTTWCRFVDCAHDFDDGVGGVGFKPITGNAVFWSNLYPNGTGHPGVWHAGMPVKRGRKIGLNIFTRRDPMTPGVTS